MIETTYLPIAQAADILQTDPDLLLTAGTEGRIRLYGLLGEQITLTSGLKLIDPKNPEATSSYSETLKQDWIDFFPIDRAACASILKTGVSGPIYWISKEDSGEQWQIDETEHENADEIIIQKSAVFVERKTIDDIRANGIPNKGTVPEASQTKNKGPENRRINNQLRVIAALMDKLGLSTDTHGTKTQVSTWIELNGGKVSEDTVGNILKAANAVAAADAKKNPN